IAPLSLAVAEIVTFTGVVPSVRRTTALVVQPAGAVLACTCTRVMVRALSFVQVAPVQVEVSAPGRNMFCSARGLALNDSVPNATPCVKCCGFVQSCSLSSCASGCKLPPLQFFSVATLPEISKPGDPEVICVSVAVRATAPFLKQVSTPPGATSRRKMSPKAPVDAALVKLFVPALTTRCMKMVVLFSTQS